MCVSQERTHEVHDTQRLVRQHPFDGELVVWRDHAKQRALRNPIVNSFFFAFG